MMNIDTLSSASGAAKYYAGYYDQKEYSQWYGKGAEMLGLKGVVKEADFLEILQGKLPKVEGILPQGQNLGRHGKDGKWEHRPGYDLPVSAPKSYSIMMLGDKELIKIFTQATKMTIDYIQNEYAFARNKVNGVEEPIQTNNLITAIFTQFFSRDLDMQLHNHIVLMNATHDGEKFRSLFSDPFSKSGEVKYLGLIFRNFLADLVQKRGYEIVETGKEGFWEFKDIPKSVNEQFSKRRKTIEAYAKELVEAGVKVDMQLANLATRPKKDESAGYDAIIEKLKQELNEKTCISMGDIDRFVKQARARGSIDLNDEKVKVSKAVDKAINHLIGFEDSWAKDKLIKQARAYGIGCDIGLIKHEIDSRISKEFLYSDKNNNIMGAATHEQIKQNIELMQNGKGDNLLYNFVAQIGSKWVLDNPTEHKREQLISLLTTKSRHVALNVKGGDDYDILRGLSRLTSGSRGYRVTGIIPNSLEGKSYTNRQRELGINGLYTLSGIKKYWKEEFEKGVYVRTHSQVFVVDKAHLFNTESINDIMVLADKLGAKVIFNTKGGLGKLKNQLGGCNVLLEKGMEQVGDSHIQSLKDKIDSLESKNKIQVVEGFDKQITHILDICKNMDRIPRIVVPTSSLKVSLNEEIRNSLVEAGEISSEAISVNILDKTSMSDIDRRHIQFYQVGYVVRGDKQYYSVKDIDRREDKIQLVNIETGEGKEWDFSKKVFQTIDVYQQREIAISKGDNLVWTRTMTKEIDGEKRIRNCLVEVLDVSDKDNIKVKDNLGHEFVIKPKELRQQHFNYAYAKTIQESIYKDSRIDVLYCPRGKIDSVKAYTCLDMLSRRGQVVVSDIGSLGGTNKSVEIEKGRDITQRDARVVIADNAVTHGMLKISERNAVFSLKSLKKEAIEYSGNRVSIEDINNAIDRAFDNRELLDTKADANKLVRDDAILLTTTENLNAEKKCVSLMQDSQDKFKPLVEIDNPILDSIRNHSVLNQSQKEAVEFILTNRDGIFAVQGIAGTGKTTIMREVVRVLNELDINVVGAVITASGRDELQQSFNSVVSKSGIEAFTVKKILNDAQKLKDMAEYPRTLFVLDESSLASTKEMLALQQLNEELGQRLLTVGDFQQNKSVGAGHPYKLLLKNGIGFKTLDVNVRLQVKRTLDATRAIYQRDVVNTINNIRVIQIKDSSLCVEKMANEYMSSIINSPGSGRAGIAILNKDRVEVNNAIRHKLKQANMLGDEGLSTQILVAKKELFDTDKTRAVSYEEGDIIKFKEGFDKIIARGEYCRVLRYEADIKTVVIQPINSDRIIDWAPDLQNDLDKIEVFVARERSDLRQNDSIVWQTIDSKRGITNGETATVLAVDVANDTFTVELRNGNILTLDATEYKNQHWDYSYTITTHLAQGRNIQDDLFYVKTKGISAISFENLLVTVTRGNNVQLITDDVPKFVKMLEENNRLPETSLELFQDGWGKEFQDKFNPEIKGAAQDLPSNVFTGEFDYLKKLDKLKEYLEASKSSGKEYFQHKQRVKTVGHEIADMIKDESLAGIEKRNALAHDIEKNVESYKNILAEHNIDVKKIKEQALKHEEKLSTPPPAELTDNKLAIEQDKLRASINDYKEVRGELIEKGLDGYSNLLDWYIAFNDNLDVGKKFVKLSDEVSVLTAKDSKIANKIYDFIEYQEKKQQPNQEQSIARRSKVNEIIRGSKPIANTIADKYAKSRNVNVETFSKDVMFNPRVYEPETKKNFPALVGIARDQNGVAQACEVMYLEEDKNGNVIRPDIETQKRSFGRKSGASVLIQKGKGDTIVLAEGKFTAMSVANANKDLTVHTSLGSNNLANFVIDDVHKKNVKQIIIVADNDGKGAKSEKSVHDAVKQFSLSGVNVAVVRPDMIDGKKADLNDVAQKFGYDAVNKVLQTPLYTVSAVTKESLIADVKNIYVDSIIDGELAKSQQEQERIDDKLVKNRQWRVKKADELYRDSVKLQKTSGDKYFKNIGIKSKVPSHFRFVENISHPKIEDNGLSAVVAPVQDKEGEFKGLFEMYVDNNGNKLNRFVKDKSGKNVKVDSHVCLANKTGNFVTINKGQDNKLFLTNTPEDGLSIMPHCKNSTVLSVLSLQNFKEIEPFNRTKEIIICASFDDITKNPHIFQAIEHLKEKGFEVSLRIPEIAGDKALSFQSLLHEHGRDAIGDSLNKPMDISKTDDNVIALSSKGKSIEHDKIVAQKQPESVKQDHVVQQQQRNVEIDRQMMR